jgi:hypothetical protein
LKLGGGARLGVSPMRVHLGLFEVPVPVKVVSIRDFDPQLLTAGTYEVYCPLADLSHKMAGMTRKLVSTGDPPAATKKPE